MAPATRPSLSALHGALHGAAHELKVPLTSEQSERLIGYVSLLQRWNAVHNLSASNDPQRLLGQHVVDCLAIVPPLTTRVGSEGVHALDAGTGAGLPAVVLATALPKWTVTAIDAVAKKVAFLRQVAGELDLPNLRPMHARLEDLVLAERCDVVTSRAFGSLSELVRQTHHLLQPTGFWVAMKGRLPEGELVDLPADCQLFHVEPLEVPGPVGARCLVWIKPNATGPAEP